MSEHDRLHIKGGCWCPPERTLLQLRYEGHTQQCTQARRGWEANYRHLAALDRQRRADEQLGRAWREAQAL